MPLGRLKGINMAFVFLLPVAIEKPQSPHHSSTTFAATAISAREVPMMTRSSA